MSTDKFSLSFLERVTFSLRQLYSGWGYKHFKMSKFEEYDLYAKNKDFLISDSVITFTDTSGKLMALKPDVTLSIIKNRKDNPDVISKVYYDENVYRVSKGTRSFKELMQVGLECIGKIGDYNIAEVLTLAVKSLKAISEDCVLDVSHLGILMDAVDALGVSSKTKEEILKCVSEKNTHEIVKICEENSVDNSAVNDLIVLVSLCGSPDDVLCKIKDSDAKAQFERILQGLSDDIKKSIRIDFSVAPDVSYYNGVVFKGFIEGVPAGVLAGGQYDNLMQRMRKKSGAIGFAVYLDMLDILDKSSFSDDVDVLLLYNENDDIKAVNKCVQELIEQGKTVCAQNSVDSDSRYKSVAKFKEGEVEYLENA